MHTFKTDKTVIHYNSDMSGNVVLTNKETGNEIEIPCSDLLDFVAAYIKVRKISNLENMTTIEILGIPEHNNISEDNNFYIEELTSCKDSLINELINKNPFEYRVFNFRNYFDEYIRKVNVDINNKYIVNFYKILLQILLSMRGFDLDYDPLVPIRFYPIGMGDAIMFINTVENKVRSLSNNVELSNDECIKIADVILNNIDIDRQAMMDNILKDKRE